jgi:hypothetical protein
VAEKTKTLLLKNVLFDQRNALSLYMCIYIYTENVFTSSNYVF